MTIEQGKQRLRYLPLRRRRPAGTIPPRFTRQISLLMQILLATLVAGLFPLLFISYSALAGYNVASQYATDTAVHLLDEKSLRTMQVRAQQTADGIAQFLEGRTDDVLASSLIPRTAGDYLSFYRVHESGIQYPIGDANDPQEHIERVPLYREMAYIDATGQEQLRIVNGEFVPTAKLRNVSDPANTTYKTETYFAETQALPRGEVYASPVMAWYTTNPAQPASVTQPGETLEGSKYGRYEAVVRFATPLFDEQGKFNGIVMLSVDFRHIMERMIHIMPVTDDGWTVYPDYKTGNYAFLFDDQGYTIAHPLLSRIRGLDAQGQVVTYMTEGMTPEETARHPFNMRYAGWSDENLPKIFEEVANKQDGFAITTNRAGARKASTYAPIPFARGVYKQSGFFGGIVIGANVNEFHKDALIIHDQIEQERARRQTSMMWIIAIGVTLLATTAILISRNIARPMKSLSKAARAIGRGELEADALDKVLNRRIEDEVNTLAHVFKQMAEQIQMRERKLKERITELRIQIDETKKKQDVALITETPYFQDLQQRAKTLRRRRDVPDTASPVNPTTSLDETSGNAST